MPSETQYFDPMFEFDAPKGIDLATEDDNNNDDTWFDEPPKEAATEEVAEPEQVEPSVVDPLDAAFEAHYKESHPSPEVEQEEEPAATEDVPPAVEAQIPSPEVAMANPEGCTFSTGAQWKTSASNPEPEAKPVEEKHSSIHDQYFAEKQRILEMQRQTILESQTPEGQAMKEQPAPTPEVPEATVEASPLKPQRLASPVAPKEEEAVVAPEPTKQVPVEKENTSPTQAFWGKVTQTHQSPKKRNASSMSRLMGETASSASKKTPRSSATRSAKRSKRADSVTPMKLTVPSSPKFSASKRTRAPKITKTREEEEMEKAREEMQKLKEMRANRSKQYNATKEAPGKHQAARSTKPLTQPKEFSFRVDSRPGAQNKQSNQEEMSLAQAVQKYQKDTPVRFRSVSRTVAAKGPTASSKGPAKLTHPDSPRFATSARARANHVKSTEELELEEMAKFQANPFKAKPVNKAIFEAHGTTGVKTVAKIPLTVPEEPKFRVNERAAQRPAPEPQDESPPKRAKHAPLGPTMPVSPKLNTDARAACFKSKLEEPVEETFKPFKAQPMPEFKKVFLPASSSTKLTEPQPFHLPGDRFHEKAKQEFEAKKAQTEREELQNREFKAQPIREYHSVSTGSAPAPKLTEVKPFNLNSEARHAEYARRMEAEREREEHEAELARRFKAQEPTVLVKSPFVPKKSSKALTEISNFALESDLRAEKREEFDRRLHAKLEEADKMKKEHELKALEEDKKEIALLRRTQMCFKANPIKCAVVPMSTKASEKPLTTPYSPALMTKSRAAMSK